jgi:hypothetical protein
MTRLHKTLVGIACGLFMVGIGAGTVWASTPSPPVPQGGGGPPPHCNMYSGGPTEQCRRSASLCIEGSTFCFQACYTDNAGVPVLSCWDLNNGGW